MKVKKQGLMGIIACLLFFLYLSESLVAISNSLVTKQAALNPILPIPLQDTTKPTWDEMPANQVLEFSNPLSMM